jgi:hypothetical protein
MFQVKPCGKVVGDINVAGVEADATRDVPVSDWFPTVDTTTVRIGAMLYAESAFKIDWHIQTTNDPSRPDAPVTLSQTQVSGTTGQYVVTTPADIDISSILTPGTATDTPAYARIMARISTSGGAASATQLVVNVQVK